MLKFVLNFQIIQVVTRLFGECPIKDLIIENKVELDFFEFIASKKEEGCGADYGGMTSYQQKLQITFPIQID